MPDTEELTPFYVDGDFSVAAPCGLQIFSSPVRSTSAEYVFTQEFMMERKSFRPLPLNTGYSYGSEFAADSPLYVLVAEGPRQDVGGGMIKWQRTYARVPASHDEFETHSYAFIGFFGEVFSLSGQLSTVSTGRPREGRTVTSRVQHDYFLCGPAPAPYPNAGAIPIIKAQRYFAGAAPIATVALDTDLILDAFGGVPDTAPNRTTYTEWINHAITLGFGSGIAPDGVNPGQIVAEDSRLSRWMGGIWLRQTRYVLAQ